MGKYKVSFGYPLDQMPGRGRVHLGGRLAKHEQWTEVILPADAAAGTIESETNKRPLVLLAIISFMAISTLALRLFSLQVTGGERNLGLAEGNRIRQKITRAPRGVIYDRNKTMLARNQASFDLTVTPALLPAEDSLRQQVYQRVSSLTGLPAAEISQKAEAKGLRQVQPLLVSSGLERTQSLLIDQSSQELTGFSLDVNPIREYLDGGILSHILGYTGRISEAELSEHKTYHPTDYIGKLGIEKQYQDSLRGTGGSEQTEVDSSGRPIKVLASKPTLPGVNLILAIDSHLQAKLTAAIAAQLEKSGTKRASGVALDPKTGEVLAAVSLPGYDNNLFSRGISKADYDRLAQDPAQPLFNKATAGTYPAGSTIKPMVAAAALEERVMTPQTTIVDEGKLEVVNQYNKNIKYVYHGWEHSGLGVMNVYRAIAMSSDIYFYTIGGGFGQFRGLGVDRLVNYFHKFGFGKRTGLDLPEESSGRVPTPEWKQKTLGEPWYTGDTYNVSVGQGDILTSPLQLAVATAAVANGGNLMKPRLVQAEVDGQGKVLRQFAPEVVRRSLISPSNLSVIREAMRQTITSGTACCTIEQQVPVPVAGKTGTAETDPGSKRKPHAWFTAFAPYDDPRIVIVVLVENSGEGSQYAAPAVRDTLAWYFSRK